MASLPKYEEVFYPSGGKNAAVNPAYTGGTLSLDMALSLGNYALAVNPAQTVGTANGTQTPTLTANSANNNTAGLPTTAAHAGWVKMSTIIANNVTTIFLPFWK